MCIGIASGYHCSPQEGDKFILSFLGNKLPYVVKKYDGRMYVEHDSDTPLGTPMTCIPVEKMYEYDFSAV